MWIQRIRLHNVRSFSKEEIEFSKDINVLVGPNNAGKSTLAYAALLVQGGFSFSLRYLRLGGDHGNVQIDLADAPKYFGNATENGKLTLNIDIASGTTAAPTAIYGGNKRGINLVDPVEPRNFVYPYLSKRKVGGYQEDVRAQFASAVTGNLQNLYAKIDKVSNPGMPAYNPYINACNEILGFVVTCINSENGKKACYIVDNDTQVTLDNMGEGVANILGLLVDLCIAKDKLFVIEELENDIHPKALKGLLRLIIEKSKDNQFIITTHSNIVTRFLGAEPKMKIFEVTMEFKDKIPTSHVKLIENTPEARRNLLEDLGYEMSDLDLWEGWLILEEASAEKIIREYLIRWFVPSLQGKLRTFSARSVDEVEPKFADFSTLFSYLNMQPAYKNRAWVIVDGGPKEKDIIERLRKTYQDSGWHERLFQQFNKHDFEKYYPNNFKGKVEEVLAINDRDKRRSEKGALLGEVEAWIRDNPEEAQAAFEKSAAEVIAKLKEIEKEMVPKQNS
ncbi:MAG: AAA family ATPase [Chloroflexota bacterium]